jgi:hypothetical protein
MEAPSLQIGAQALGELKLATNSNSSEYKTEHFLE